MDHPCSGTRLGQAGRGSPYRSAPDVVRDYDSAVLTAALVPTSRRSSGNKSKVFVWTSDDVLVTSHNWGSASTDLPFPQVEVDVHVRLPGFVDAILERLPPKSTPTLRTQTRTAPKLFSLEEVGRLPSRVGAACREPPPRRARVWHADQRSWTTTTVATAWTLRPF